MIVCSCNVLSDKQILSTLRNAETVRPCSPAHAYRGLGCAPRCGRCVPTIRALLAGAQVASCQAACRKCPARDADRQAENEELPEQLLLAAE